MLSTVDTRRLTGLKYKLICRFKLAVDMVGVASGSFLNNMNGPAFLERQLMGIHMDGYR